jgi:sugar transferase (PEP-CTERM/EpsH1 system associated)
MVSSTVYRKKLVILLSRFPYPLEKGDKLRAYNQLKELSKHFKITLITTTDEKIHKESIEEIKRYCSTIYIIKLSKISILINLFFQFFTNKPFQTGYFFSSKNKARIESILKEIKPDHIYCQLIRISEYVKNYHDCPKTIDYMDALSKGMERRALKAPFYLKWLFNMEAKRLSDYERKIFDYFENQIMISEQDKNYILHPNRSNIICIPNGVDKSFFETYDIEKDADIVFIGNLSYAPNIEATLFLHEKILPYFILKNPTFKLLISGASPSISIKKIADINRNIELTGWVDDIKSSYARGKIFVAPMMIGTGMQNKLIEAMAMGIPCVTTTLANNAIQAVHNESILVANSQDEFILEIERLLNDKDLYHKIALAGKKLVQSKYQWESTTKILVDLIH